MSATARAAIVVPGTPDRAFSLFTEAMDEWWPREYTWSQAKLDRIGMEPRLGGLCFELGPFGFRCDWGRVTVWERPERLVFLWQIGPTRAPEPDPERASEVEVEFLAADDGVSVELVHSRFERHGEGSEEYAAGMDSPQGWTYILERFAARVLRD